MLGALLALCASGSFAGGFPAVPGGQGSPGEWLPGELVASYSIPGVFLFILIVGLLTFAVMAVLSSQPFARGSVLAGMLLLLTWGAMQMDFIGYASWWQSLVLGLALAIFLLMFLLGRHHRHAG